MKLLLWAPFLLASPLVWAIAADKGDIKIATLIDEVKPAKPLDRPEPRYPTIAAKKGQEGWVLVSFVVSKDGDVIDPIVEDSSGISSFEKAAVSAMRRWKYDPAMRDGEPIEQCHTKVQMDFALNKNSDAGVRRSFHRQYNEIHEFLSQGDIEQAQARFETLGERAIHNRYENAWYWMMDSDLGLQSDDLKRSVKGAARAIFSATQPDVLGKENYTRIVFRKFATEIELGWFGDAIETFARAKDKYADQLPDLIAQMQPYAEQLEGVMNSDKPLSRKVTLEDDTSWAYSLHRNHFAIDAIDGQLNTVEIRCQNHRSRYTAMEDNIWSIPEKWGACRVHVSGMPGSQFDFLELASNKT